MKSFDPSIVLELAKEGFIFFLLTAIELQSGTVRYADADIDLWYGGNKYDSSDFTFDQVATSGSMGVDSVSVTYNNATRAMAAVVLSEDILGRPFTLSFVCCVSSSSIGTVDTEAGIDLILEGGLVDGEAMMLEAGENTIIGGHDLFYGLVSDWKITEESVWMEIQNELAFWSKKPLRKCSSSCPWEFKGTECTYSGVETWCDQSYERCYALLNSDNFGGFRFLPEIEEKEIWWGRSPE